MLFFITGAFALNIQKMKIMASGPITSWEIDGETVETVSDLIFGGSKITADGDCSHEIIQHIFLSAYPDCFLDCTTPVVGISLPLLIKHPTEHDELIQYIPCFTVILR